MKELLEMVTSKILTYSGICVAQAQLSALEAHLEKQAAIRKMTPLEFASMLTPNTPDFDAIINLVTVNETYFFREECQFDFLKNEVFPKFMGRKLTIWSCCCSTGEEPVSLLALALSMNIDVTVYASDIDDGALNNLSHGHYSQFSLRTDGTKYHELLKPYSTRKDKEIIFNKSFLERIKAFKFNLIQGDYSTLPFYESVDIIFMRNVFIYFDKKTRATVTEKVSERLKNGGKLFFSMNEIGSMDNTIIPKELHKTNSGIVYYFEKNTKTKGSAEETPVGRSLKSKQTEKENQKVKSEVQKVLVQKHSDKNKEAHEKTVSKNIRPAPVFDAKQTYEFVCQEIHNRDFNKARSIARDIKGSDTKKYSFFMQGYVEYQADNRAEAETLFASAESISPDFWPAFFYHGMVLRDLGRMRHAQTCFVKCKELIAGFGSDLPYDFALDKFSPSYINSLCDIFSNGGGQ